MRDAVNELDGYFAKVDRWIAGEDEQVPLEVLRARGIVIAEDDSALDDAALHAALWTIIREMYEIGLVIYWTDHLSDRELYRQLVRDTLTQPTSLDDGMTTHISMCSDHDSSTYLRFYAEEQDRAMWQRDWPDDVLPPKEPLPYSRDHLLPGRC